jgi:hypothetical protein
LTGTAFVRERYLSIARPDRDLREIRLAPDRATAQAAMTTFAEKYARKYTGALDCAENAPAE